MTDLDSLIEHHLIKTNGITLHVVTAGPADGQPVVLLHGFPEFWYGWKEQIPALVGDDDAVARRRQHRNLFLPAVPKFGEAVQQHDRLAVGWPRRHDV